jgi:hypothetical protein
MKMLSLLPLLIAVVSVLHGQQDQGTIIPLGERLVFRSAILNEERSLLISAPRSFPAAKVTYPVIYVLDGASLFPSVVAASQFLAYNSYVGVMPEAVIVGIVNTKRDRDMPVPQVFLQTQDHAAFLRSIAQEVVPLIASRYPVNGLNVLIGHSQGGLFATYAGTEMPDLFKGIIALDAPVTVVPAVLKTLRLKMEQRRPVKYYSAEALYGWGSELGLLSKSADVGQQKIVGETHESMPFKGIYDGLRFLFSDHIPSQTDGTLKGLQTYYGALSERWGSDYAVPGSVVMHQSVPMMLGRSKKTETLELLQWYDRMYGASAESKAAGEKAASITAGPDERVEYYLNLPSPSDDAVRPYLGTWSGTLVVPGGMDTRIEWEIKKNDGRYVLAMNVMDSFILKNDFLQISKEGELRWGRKHQSGGLYLSVARLSKDGKTLEGTEDLIGHHLAEGEPPFVQNRFKFTRIKQ